YLFSTMMRPPWSTLFPYTTLFRFLVVVGAGPVEQELKQQALRLNLKNIHFIGQTDEQGKVDLFAACYAVVFPSHLRSEAFGISLDRKSTRLNSSHVKISYAVFCLKK